jgi:hypothetical protein
LNAAVLLLRSLLSYVEVQRTKLEESEAQDMALCDHSSYKVATERERRRNRVRDLDDGNAAHVNYSTTKRQIQN